MWAAPVVLGAASAVALMASYFTTVVYVTTGSASCVDLATAAHSADCVKTGGDQHSVAFILLGVAVLALVTFALARGVVPAATAVVVVGAIALLIALIGDLPQASKTGFVGHVVPGTAHAGTGLWLEIVGGALAIASGLTVYGPARAAARAG